MADYSVTYGETGTVDTTRVPSPAIWRNCNWLDFERGENSRQGQGTQPFMDDFLFFPLAGTQTTQIGFGNYKIFATSSSSIAGVSAVNSVDLGGGILDFLVDASTHSASLAQAYPGYKVTGDPSTGDKLWFECRIALDSVTTNVAGLFVGLAETSLFTLATAVPFTSNTGIALSNAGSFLGFNKPAVNTTTMNTVYNDRATSFSILGTGEVGSTTLAGAVAANTFTKLGMLYDPNDRNGRNVRFFQDNYELTTAMTNTQIKATTNLKANSLGIMMSVVGGSAASSNNVYLDWWRIAQLYPA